MVPWLIVLKLGHFAPYLVSFRMFGGLSKCFLYFCPSVEGFVFEGSSLGVVLVDLVPFLRQSVDWFEDLVGE